MPLSEICALPVADIADENCLLFLWITSPELPDAFKVGKSWGFKYITVGFVWNKQIPVKGHYTMSLCEQCLTFKKGKIPQPQGARNVRQLYTEQESIEITLPEFLSIKKGSHSVKPYQIAHRITKMFPTQSKIELFARPTELTKIAGWDYWGNEV